MRIPTVACFLGTVLVCGCNKGESVATEEAAEVAAHTVAATVSVGTGCRNCAAAGAISDQALQALLSPPRQHYEIIDPQDGLFVTYWEKYYDVGMSSLDLFPNGYRLDVNYIDPNGDPAWPGDTNNVSGKGRRYCYGDVIDWTVDAESGVLALGVYGWFESPLVEYYIGREAQWGDVSAGQYMTSRGRYELWVQGFARANVINPENDPSRPQKFLQYNLASLDGADPQVGPVDLSEHFAAWEALMSAFWADPASSTLRSSGYTWHPLQKANYCVVATELAWNIVGYGQVSNISVTTSFPQTMDVTCDGVDNDGDGSVDEDWTSGFCILPPSHPTCGNGTHFGTTACSGGVEICVPEAAGTADVCDGEDNDCDGKVDEDFVPSTRNCGTEVGRCQNKETLTCAGAGGEVWGACTDGLDPIHEVACNNEDDDCDGRTDEGSINLPIKCVLDRDEDGIEDGLDTQPDTYSNEFGEGDFGTTSGVIVNRGDQAVVVFDPPRDDGVRVETLATGGWTKAEVSLCGGTVTLAIGPGESQVVTCPETACLFASEQLRVLDHGKVWSDFYAGSFILQWDVKVYGAGLSTGNGRLLDRAQITGGATLGGTLSGYRAGVTPLVEGATVAPQVLRVFSILVAGADVTVPDNGTTTLSPGDYGDAVVGAGGTLVLNAAGTYRFNSLTFASDTRLDLTAAGAGTVTLAVEGNLVLGDRWEKLGKAQMNAYANGASVVAGYDSKLSAASIQAPFAVVEVKDRAQVNGCIKGRRVTLGKNTQLHGASSGGPGPGPAVLSAHLTKTRDWGRDYCVTIDVTNLGGSRTGWVATINTGGSSIYNRWNGSFSGTWGTVTAAPNQSWNLTIDPGETDTSVGFCARRWFPGQMATLVSIVPRA